MTNTIRLYNQEELQAIVEANVAETLAASVKFNFEAARALKREKKRIAQRSRIVRHMKEFFVLGLPVWGCTAMVIYWLAFGY